MIAVGKADAYLTYKPEITFFKKIYKRHTNFAIELNQIFPEYQYDFNTNIAFKLSNCDAIYRCYIEVELPLYQFNDTFITTSTYLTNKTNKLNTLTNLLNLTTTNYNNYKNYINLELELYKVEFINFVFVSFILERFLSKELL